MLTNKKEHYYLQNGAVSIYELSPNTPEYLIVSVASGSAVRISAQLETSNPNYENTGKKIGYKASLAYRDWTFTGGNIKLSEAFRKEDRSFVPLYIYVRADATPLTGNTGIIVISPNMYDIDGYLVKPRSADGNTENLVPYNDEYEYVLEQDKDAQGNPVGEPHRVQKDTGYFYICIGEINYDGTGKRQFVIETGSMLGTNAGDDNRVSQSEGFKVEQTATGKVIRPIYPLVVEAGLDIKGGKLSLYGIDITGVVNESTMYKYIQGLLSAKEWDGTFATTKAIIALVAAEIDKLDDRFLRKDQDDETEFGLTADTLTAKGSVTAASASVGTLESKNGSSLQGTTKFSPNYTEGVAGGAITHPNAQSANDAKLQIEYLHVLKKATFESLEVNHVEHIAGNLVMSPAKATLYGVKNMDSFYRCYFLASDSDGNTINNTWRKDDQAYCCTFDTATLGVTDENGKPIVSGKTGNHYYWCLVKAVSTSPVSYDGKQCHYIDLCYSSNPLETDYGSDTPWPGDYVVLRGNRTDENRQGTIELNTSPDMKGDGITPSVRIYNGINSFSMPSPKIDMNPHHVKMLIDELKIVTGGENKTIKDYIEQETDQFHIFETETSDIPTLYNEPFISWSEGERVKYSQSPNNAVILNKDGRTWRFFKNEVTNEYYFEEFTDPWLLAQHTKITNILDDKVISANEIPSMKEIAQKVLASWDDAEAEFGKFDDPSQNLSDKLDALAEAVSLYYDDFLSNSERSDLYPTPIYFSDYKGEKEDGHYQYPFTRDKAIEYATAYERAITAWNYALASEKQSKIGETAAEEAKQEAIKYVSEHIDDIMRESTKEVVDGWIEEYTDGRFTEDSVYQSDKQSIGLYTQWIDKNFPERVGGTGLWAKLNQMFVGTQTITFNPDGTVKNIDKSGLVTDSQFAALTSRVTNAEGKIVTEATISTWIENSFDNEANAQKLISHATISADKVSITSGKPGTLGNYWSIDEDGNAILKDIYARDITVSGVLLNLITTLEAGDERYIPSLKDKVGNVIANDLDVLRCGDVVRIKSTNGGNVNSIRLPYYINDTYSQRTLTMYGNKEHLITAEELRMLVGKRMTIIIEEGSGLSNYKSLKGVLNLESPYKTDFGQRIDELVNGTPVFALPEGLAENLEIAPSVPGTYNLQFKACIFKNGETYFTGYAWVYTSINLTATEIEWEDET